MSLDQKLTEEAVTLWLTLHLADHPTGRVAIVYPLSIDRQPVLHALQPLRDALGSHPLWNTNISPILGDVAVSRFEHYGAVRLFSAHSVISLGHLRGQKYDYVWGVARLFDRVGADQRSALDYELKVLEARGSKLLFTN